MKKYRKIIILLIGLVLIFSGVRYFGLDDVLTFENLNKNRQLLTTYVGQHYVQSVILYIGIYIIVVAVNLPGAAVMTLSGGLLFGILPAMLYVNISATVGGSIAFMVSRKFLGEFFQAKFGQQLKKFNSEIDRYGKNYLLTMRLIPVFPFFFVNIAAGMTKISLMTFVWTTSLGTIPGTFAYVYAGYNIGNIASNGQVLSPQIIFALVLLGIAAVVPTFINKRKEKNRLEEEMHE